MCFPTLALALSPVLELPSTAEIEIEMFEGQGRQAPAILWLPSERGFVVAQREHARALAQLGHSVWLADLHNAYFVRPGRSSISHFPIEDIVAIIDAAVTASDGQLILLSGSRGAQLTLIAAREWQLRHPGKTSISGIILAHAHLYDARPEPGESATYLPIVEATNLPVYLLAAQYSTKYSRLQELAVELGAGNSRVYTQVLSGVRGGFHAGDPARMSDLDKAARQGFAATLSRAAGLLRQSTAPSLAMKSSLDTRRLGRNSATEPVLTTVAGSPVTPPLQLTDLDGADFVLEAHRGEVMLINFWASWCRPCVVEIPSLHRLDAKLKEDDFRIVTVNVGEDAERINRFTQQVAVELPILMDYDASISRDWKIYVYPSSYLVDRQGKIRYAYLGALEWDSAENIRIIQNLLSER